MKRFTFCLSMLFLFVSAYTSAQNTVTPVETTTDSTVLNVETPVTDSLQTPIIAQPVLIKGRIVDAQTGEALPYATVSVKKLGIGTASNLDGDFSLKIPASGAFEKINIHFMGYTAQEMNIADISGSLKILLVPSSYEIAEVVVLPGDYIGDLLRKAYKSIPENYPTKSTLCDGFYRETERLNDSLFLYFNEAVLNVYKNTYSKDLNFGQIRIEKSRKNVFPGIDSINDVRFYGGPHFPNDLDIVFSRWDFIKPSELKNWVYEMESSQSDFYVITFKNRKAPNSNFRGRMFINKDNLAYESFELKRAGLSVFSQNASSDAAYIPGNTTAKIGYVEQDGLYNLAYITYKTNGVNTASKKRIYKDIEYVTTALKTDSVSPIPFSQQFDYTDILSIEADNYDQSYWKDYNVLQESSTMSAQTNMLYGKDLALKELTKVYNKELTQDEKILLFLKRFTFDGGFAYLPVRYLGGSHQITYGTATANESVKSNYFGISTMDGLRFELTKQLTIFSTISAALYGIDQIQYDLGMSYRMSLAPSGRWIFLDLGLAASTSNTKVDICKLTNTDANLQIGGKTFDSDNIAVKAGKSGYGIRPVAGIAVRMGKKYELFVDGSYFLPFLFKKEYVQLKETEGSIFGRKSVKLNWGDPNLSYMVDGIQMTNPRLDVMPYQFRIGIRSGF